MFAISCFNSPYAIFFYISVQKLYDTYNSTLYVINYYCPFGRPPLINKNGWRTCYYYIIGGFYNNAKAILTTRIAGGLFVFQSSVFRINEKLHNGKQGFALTTKTAPKRKSFQDCLLVYSYVLLSVLYRTEVIFYQYLAAHTGES